MSKTNPRFFTRFVTGLSALAFVTVVGTSADVARATPAPGLLPAPTAKPAPTPAPSEPDPSGVKVDGDVLWTAVSGDTGPKSAILGQESDFQALYTLTWWEDGDDPCKFDAITRHLNQADNKKVDTAKFCSGSPGNDKNVGRRGKNEYVTALQVCATDKKDSRRDKIKGVRFWGKVVDTKTGILGPDNGPEEVAHTNCKEWKTKVACPAGMIASKIKVYSERYTLPNGMETEAGFAKGLALGCRRVMRK